MEGALRRIGVGWGADRGRRGTGGGAHPHAGGQRVEPLAVLDGGLPEDGGLLDPLREEGLAEQEVRRGPVHAADRRDQGPLPHPSEHDGADGRQYDPQRQELRQQEHLPTAAGFDTQLRVPQERVPSAPIRLDKNLSVPLKTQHHRGGGGGIGALVGCGTQLVPTQLRVRQVWVPLGPIGAN